MDSRTDFIDLIVGDLIDLGLINDSSRLKAETEVENTMIYIQEKYGVKLSFEAE